MRGSLALVGSGEYLPEMAELEKSLIQDGLNHGKANKFIQIPTAAGRESKDRLEFWRELGARQASLIGTEQMFLPIFDRESANSHEYADLISDGALIYMSGGDPHFLAETLTGTPVWKAILKNWHSGGSLAGMMWEEEGFALSEGFESATGIYDGLVLPGAGGFFGAITDQTLLVKPEVAKAQMPAVITPHVDVPGGSTPAPTSVITTPGVVDPKASTRFFGVYEVDPERYSRDLNRLSQEILQHLSSIDGVDLDITIEIHAAIKEGFAADKIRVILENARSLKFKNSSFEKE